MIKDKEKFLAQEWHTFDQDHEKWWRSITNNPNNTLAQILDEKIYSQVANLIEEYCALHEKKLEHHANALMIFHSGQLYAMDNNYTKAVPQFEWVLNNYPQIVGKEYIEATLYFLKGEKEKLLELAKKMKKDETNRETVQRLQKWFKKTYYEAYTGSDSTSS